MYTFIFQGIEEVGQGQETEEDQGHEIEGPTEMIVTGMYCQSIILRG